VRVAGLFDARPCLSRRDSTVLKIVR
jgi:hypothetical protein